MQERSAALPRLLLLHEEEEHCGAETQAEPPARLLQVCGQLEVVHSVQQSARCSLSLSPTELHVYSVLK